MLALPPPKTSSTVHRVPPALPQFLRTAADNRAARRAAGLHHLRAGEDRGATGNAVNVLRRRREICAPLSVPLTTSRPPVEIVVVLALPPESTTCVPPLTIVLLAVPPLSTTCEPLKIVALLAVPETSWVPPLICTPASVPLTTSRPPVEIVVALALPPESTSCVPPLDDRGAARSAAALHHLRAGEDRGAVGSAGNVLVAARDLRTGIDAADNFQATCGNRRGTGAAAGIHYLRAATDNGAARSAAGMTPPASR